MIEDKRMIKALFFDIDGTLVSTRTHRIPDSTVSAIAEAKARGLRIYISTGRPPALMDNVGQLQERGLIDGYVTMNGSYVFTDDRVLCKRPIPEEDWRTMGAFCRDHGYSCTFIGVDCAYVYQSDEKLERIFYHELNARHMEPIDWQDIRFDVMQMSPFIDLETENSIKPQLKGCEFGRWHPGFVDINVAGCTKQEGIEVIMQELGLTKDEIMTFGDGGNDISMLKMAGTGVAMGNASGTVKAAADYVTAHIDDDGIAKALRHFGLINK